MELLWKMSISLNMNLLDATLKLERVIIIDKQKYMSEA